MKNSLSSVKLPPVGKRREERDTRRSPKIAKVSVVTDMIKAINEKIGSSVAVSLGSVSSDSKHGPVVGWVKTGIWALDWIIGDWRGIPLGRITVMWGDEGCGKSSVAQFFIKCFQRQSGVAQYVDSDNALDYEQLERGEVDLDRVVRTDVVTLEEGFDAIKGGIEGVYGKFNVSRGQAKKKKRQDIPDQDGDAPTDDGNKKSTKEVAAVPAFPMLIVYDSVSASGPRELHEEDDAEEYHIGAEARIISAQTKKMRQWIRGKPVHVILLAESRANIGAVGRFAPQSKMAGAKALRFTPSTILRVGFAGVIRKGERVTGHRMYVSVDRKARLSKPGRKAEIVISYSRKPGVGGPNVAKSNLLFLDETAGLIKNRGKAGITISGLEDVVGVFKRAEWPGIMAKHGKAIRAAVKEALREPDGDD